MEELLTDLGGKALGPFLEERKPLALSQNRAPHNKSDRRKWRGCDRDNLRRNVISDASRPRRSSRLEPIPLPLI
jgi:hypothetical protein